MSPRIARRRGQSFAEFGFILLLVTVAVVGTVTLFGENIADFYSGLTEEVEEAIPTPTPNPAFFTYSPETPLAGEPVTFDGPDSASTYDWNFGDGGTDNVAAPTYIFMAAGTWTVTLTTDEGTYFTDVEVFE